MLNKESKLPSGFGRLISTAKYFETFQDGMFENGHKAGYFKLFYPINYGELIFKDDQH